MKTRFICYCLIIITLAIFFGTVTAFSAAADTPDAGKSLNIVTTDNRPLYIDRLLYTAFKDMGYDTSLTVTSLQEGYNVANNGYGDAVIAATPNISEIYGNLVQVPVVLDSTEIHVLARSGTGLKFSSWEELANYDVGRLSQRIYIENRISDNSKVFYYSTNKLLLEGLVKGEYDVVVLEIRSHETFILPEGVEFAGKLDVLPEYLYLNEKHSNLLPEISSSLRKLFADGRGERIIDDRYIFEENQKKTILHVVSSDTEVVKEDLFKRKLTERFSGDDTTEWYTMPLNANRFFSTDTRLASIAQLLRQDCVSKNVAAIIVSGDDALEFIKEYYYTLFRNVPVLFNGVSDKYAQSISDYEPYFTGIVEHVSAYETVSLALQLFPDTQSIYVINDYTTEGQEYRKSIEEQLQPFAEQLSIEYNENVARDSLLAHIRSLPKDSILLAGSYFRDGNGQYFPMNDMKRVLSSSCSVPSFSLYSTDIGYNAIGGKVPDSDMHGEVAALMLRRLLGGEKASDIPIIYNSASYNRWVFDETKINSFNVSKKLLPQNSLILNKKISIWESDPRFVITLLSSFAVIIAIIITVNTLQAKYRKQLEHMRMMDAVAATQQNFQKTLDILPVAVGLIDVETNKLIFVNRVAYKLFGYNRADEMAGKPVTLFLPEDQRNRPIFSELMRLTGNTGDSITLDSDYLKADGSVIEARVIASRITYKGRLTSLEILQDLAEIKELERTRLSLQTIIDTMPAPIRITDRETGVILYANHACVELFGYASSEAMCGKHLTEMVSELQSDGTDSRTKLTRLLDTTETMSMDIEYLAVDGRVIDSNITCCAIEYNSRKSTLAIIADLTAEKEYENMLLNAAQKEKEANLLKSRFLVNMSHEIRTPMNAVIGLTEIELRKNPDKETREIYTKINSSAKTLLNIINDILDLSKIEADKMELYSDEFELEEVLNNALLVAVPRLDGKNVEFILNESLDLPRFIIGDKTRLWQILKNFLDNSAKYTENGKIVLTVFADNRQSDDETVYITFSISDTGIGLDEEQIERVFMPYEQIYNNAQKKYTGTGLGMVISKQVCELMGGKMQIESKLGEGTTISLGIPFKRSGIAETGRQLINISELTGVRILIVDDDELSLSIMSNLINNSNATCDLARSGQEALDTILKGREKGEAYDLILLDYMMDGLNGLETAEKIQTGLSVAPKLLMVTAYQRLLLKRELEKYNISDIIEKPFIPSKFIQKICDALEIDSNNMGNTQNELARFENAEVLLCEDFRLNQEIALGMLEQFGVTAVVAENGQEGVNILNTGKHFDLILMDLQMPVMDGYEATSVIRADKRFDHIPIISLTADAMREITEKCLEMGMNDHVSKPIEFDSLQRALIKWLPESKRVTTALPENANKSGTPNANGLDSALARLGGDKDRYEKMLVQFAEILHDEWPDFDSAAADIEETKRYVHKIKGVAGNLAEKELYQSCVDFEASARGSAPDKDLYERMVRESDDFKKRIAAKSKAAGDISDKAAETGTNAEFKEILGNLKAALNDYDMKRVSLQIDGLKAKSWSEEYGVNLSTLYKLVQDYDYDSALDIIEALGEISP